MDNYKPTPHNITVVEGHTYDTVLRWSMPSPIRRVPILAITHPYGCAHIKTSEAHGLLDGWNVAITNVNGCRGINVTDPNDIKDDEWQTATVAGLDEIDLNDLNIAGFSDYIDGGFVQYLPPVDLTGITIRVQILNRRGGTLLASNQSADGALNLIQTTIDLAKKTISVFFPLTVQAAIAGRTAYYDIEAVDSGNPPRVKQLAFGEFTVERE